MKYGDDADEEDNEDKADLRSDVTMSPSWYINPYILVPYAPGIHYQRPGNPFCMIYQMCRKQETKEMIDSKKYEMREKRG
jgi:hypothetical protein